MKGILKVPSTSQIAREPSPNRAGTPMSVRDLGSDYTRYFSPYSDSRRSSWGEPPSGTQTPLARNASSSRLLGLNPFEPVSDKSGHSSPNLDTDNMARERQALLSSPFIDDRMGASPYVHKHGRPYAFPMFIDEKEDDDDMHMPMPDDNIRYKPKMRDHLSRENICSTIGLALMVVGLLFIFIILPVMFYTGLASLTWAYETPLDQMPGYGKPEKWAVVNNRKYPYLKNIRTKLIDDDTPKSARTRKSHDGTEMNLVFSDEFNDNNRTFYEGDDPYWFAGDFWYGATQDLDWYDPDAVTTWDGTLELRLDAFHNHDLNFRSGMLNSWNQLCFKGGAFEVGVSLPGPAGIMGLWPGAWTMGNLGRPGYLSTTDGMWPYTYNDCDAGITPNQSSPDGISRLPGQRLPSCTCDGEDHPSPGTGRGAPEIDILEASASYQVKNLGVITQSFQVAPFDPWYALTSSPPLLFITDVVHRYYPDYDYMSFPEQNVSYTNTYTGGPYQQAVSGTTTINNDWYDGNVYQKYAYDYRPGTGKDSWITWYVGDDIMFTMDGRAIRKNGNVGNRLVSEEPMSMILNLGFSNSWVAIDWANLKFPTIMRVDYVRIYQPEGEEMITCDPPGYETTDYIAEHMDAYTNPNFTVGQLLHIPKVHDTDVTAALGSDGLRVAEAQAEQQLLNHR